LWFWSLRVRVPSTTRLRKLQIPSSKLQNFLDRLWDLEFGSLGFFKVVSVAQLDRASDFGSEGWGFESLQARILLAVIVAGVIAAFGWLVWKCQHDPKINFLPHDGRYQWIIFPTALNARSHPVATIDATFRRTFSLQSKPKTARLLVRAAKRLELRINSETVPISPSRTWKEMSTVDVQNFLRSGENTIEARVFNDNAPPALWLHLDADGSNLRTNGSWQASIAGSLWRNCALASEPRSPGPGNLLAGGEKVSDVLPKLWRAWIAFGILAVLLAFACERWLRNDVDLSRNQVVGLVGICVLAWVVLFWNNAKMLPFHSGYDVNDHVAYIKYIQNRGTLPLPNEGYEMFQPPLFYALSAGLLSIFRLSTDDASAITVLRALTMFFGIVNFVFVFLSLRLLFPGRAVAQLVGLITAAFLPMQLYLSHYVTNETLAATLASVSIYFGLRVLTIERVPVWKFLVLGCVVGAAMLAKATALLLIPPLIGAVGIKLLRQRAPIWEWTRTFGAIVAAILIVCGWHYVRIWRHFGTPIVGNWDPILRFPWWQDPGFHTAADYFRFGQSLVTPLFSSFNGFADGIYSTLWGDGLGGGLSGLLSRTPWNYSLMIGGYWLAVVPTLLVVLGAAIAIFRFVRQVSAEWFLLLGFSAATVIALIFMTLKVPSYAQVKAFYGLAALIPFCAFAVVGWQLFAPLTRIVRSIVTTLLIFIAINSFASVWIRPSSELHIYDALRLIGQSQPTAAVAEATAAVASDPSNSNASYVLAAVLDEIGDTNAARAECEHCLELNPSNGDCVLQKAVILAKEPDLGPAINAAQRARDLLPENPQAHDLLFTLARELHHGEDTLLFGKTALAVSPFDSDLHYRIGLAAGELGDFRSATQQFAYALLLNSRIPDYEQKLRVALSYLVQTPDSASVIEDLKTLATGSPKLLEILASYRQDPSSTQQDRQ
jgi:dolichyl-phosphate-mannose-protein mannosyltransferase